MSVVGDRVFLMGDQEKDCYLIALSRTDGSKLWSAKVGKAGASGRGGFAGPRATPTVNGDLVYAVGQYGAVLCADAAKGGEVWRKDYAKDFVADEARMGFYRDAAH